MWVPEPVWTRWWREKFSALALTRTPDHPARSPALYHWAIPAPPKRICHTYEDVTKSFRTGRLERELQIVQLSATRRNCITILWVSLVTFIVITLCCFSTSICCSFFIDSVRKLLDTLSDIIVPLRLLFTRSSDHQQQQRSLLFTSKDACPFHSTTA
jgi:hypothetical protein